MKVFGITDKGKIRKENQDSYSIVTLKRAKAAILVVCDGMGGAQGGKTAGKIGSDVFTSHVKKCLNDKKDTRPPEEIAVEAAHLANKKIFERSSSDKNCRGMGTTLVGAIVSKGQCHLVNVGDSRAYLLSERGIEKISRDHSLVGDMVLKGDLTEEEARLHPKRNLITRAMGVEPEVIVDTFVRDLTEGDLVFLCSDGLTNTVTEDEVFDMFMESPDPEEICQRLLALSLSRNASDNVTVMALRYENV